MKFDQLIKEYGEHDSYDPTQPADEAEDVFESAYTEFKRLKSLNQLNPQTHTFFDWLTNDKAGLSELEEIIIRYLKGNYEI